MRPYQRAVAVILTVGQQQRMKEYLKKPEVPRTTTKIGLEKQKKPPRKSRC